MRPLFYILLLCSALLGAQQKTPPPLPLVGVQNFFADDYGNFYIYKPQDFSFTKYDAAGRLLARQMFALPFRIQSVQNPLSIPAFSENAQELRFYDHHLNLIQTISFRQKFGFIKMAYAEDLQQIWLMDEGSKQLLQYNYRDDKVVASLPLFAVAGTVLDLVVHDGLAYILTQSGLTVLNMKTSYVTAYALAQPRKLMRENSSILIFEKNAVWQVGAAGLALLYQGAEDAIVDKNSDSYFELRGNKLYLYPIKS